MARAKEIASNVPRVNRVQNELRLEREGQRGGADK